jgi:hypothetical protein
MRKREPWKTAGDLWGNLKPHALKPQQRLVDDVSPPGARGGAGGEVHCEPTTGCAAARYLGRTMFAKLAQAMRRPTGCPEEMTVAGSRGAKSRPRVMTS